MSKDVILRFAGALVLLAVGSSVAQGEVGWVRHEPGISVSVACMPPIEKVTGAASVLTLCLPSLPSMPRHSYRLLRK